MTIGACSGQRQRDRANLRRCSTSGWRTTATRPLELALIGLAGARGSITLTAALSIPLVTASGQALAGRDLAVFLAAGTIAATLLLQALVPLLLPRAGSAAEPDGRERSTRLALARAAIDGIDAQAPGGGASPAAHSCALKVKQAYQRRLRCLMDDAAPRQTDLHTEWRLERAAIQGSLAAERRELTRLLRMGAVNEEMARLIEREIDWTELALRHDVP